MLCYVFCRVSLDPNRRLRPLPGVDLMRKNQVRSRERADFQEHVNTLRCDTVVVSAPACRLHWVF